MSQLPTIDTEGLARALASEHPPLVLVVAAEAEFRRRRIPGSRRFGDPGAIGTHVAASHPLVLTGATASGLAFAWAYRLLHEMGFSDVRVHAQGLAGWAAAGERLEGDDAPANP